MVVGDLADDRGRVYFEYAAGFLATGLELSPFRLPAEPGLTEHRDRGFGPLPGLFDDSLPDGWGLLLMDRHFRSLGLNPAGVGPLERLAWLGTWTMGALTYHPPDARDDAGGGVLDLHDLATHSQEILDGPAVDVLPELLRAGGSPGGARPKVLVGLEPGTGRVISGQDHLPEGFEHWMVKFAAKSDDPEAGPLEYAYSLMAREAGIEVPLARLFETSAGDRFFGVRRFDREGNRRRHVHTFGNLIHSNFRIPSADYQDLLRATRLLTRNHEDVLRAFRLTVFNVLAHNRDDHVKNFAFILDDERGDWALAPAYDLMFAPGPGGEHSMTVAGEGRAPNRSHLLALAEGAEVSRREAEAVIEEVRAAVARWSDHARAAGVTAATAGMIARALPRLA
jgi:serine/threonine-protein kinase HipA